MNHSSRTQAGPKSKLNTLSASKYSFFLLTKGDPEQPREAKLRNWRKPGGQTHRDAIIGTVGGCNRKGKKVTSKHGDGEVQQDRAIVIWFTIRAGPWDSEGGRSVSVGGRSKELGTRMDDALIDPSGQEDRQVASREPRILTWARRQN